MRFATLVLTALVVASAPSFAGAGGPRAGLTGDPRVDQFIRPGTGIPPIRDPRAGQFIRDNTQTTVTVPEHHRRAWPWAVQQNVIVVSPVVVAPWTGCSAAGYWTYQWVPQTTTTQQWIPGYWTSDGTWIDAGWQTQTVETGYWQPIWVPDAPGC